MGSREPRSPDTCIPMVSCTADGHSFICACVNTYSLYTLGLRSVMTTALDNDERLHSEVSLKQEQGNVRTLRSASLVPRPCVGAEARMSFSSREERGERLQRRTPRNRQLRTIESADDRLERLQRRRQRERQLRTGDRESADDRLTSATTPALSEYHRVSRWQARTSATEKTTRGSD